MLRGMKKIVLALFLMFAATFMHADTINLLGGSNSSYAYSYSFPVGSPYASSYGTGLGLLETGTWSTGAGGTWLEAIVGTTKGNITSFAYNYFDSSLLGYLNLSNAKFNSKTDSFTGSFVSAGKTWHLTEVYGSANYSYNYGTYSFTASNLKSAQMTTVPEPNTLLLLGTGVVSLAGAVRKKLKFAAVS
jgi:PEP-CTERM motif